MLPRDKFVRGADSLSVECSTSGFGTMHHSGSGVERQQAASTRNFERLEDVKRLLMVTSNHYADQAYTFRYLQFEALCQLQIATNSAILVATTVIVSSDVSRPLLEANMGLTSLSAVYVVP